MLRLSLPYGASEFCLALIELVGKGVEARYSVFECADQGLGIEDMLGGDSGAAGGGDGAV